MFGTRNSWYESASNETTLLARWKRALAAFMAVGFLSSCSQQQFSIPSENLEFGEKITYNKDVDVLWVIDTSGSMSEHQGLLATQVGLFVDSLKATGLDYRMGVTTMDMSASGARGKLLAQAGTPAILTAQTPDLSRVLGERLKAGETGSPVERGQEAMKAALDSSGFVRNGSLLVVIFLTNEEDESPMVDYKSYLDGLKPVLPTGERGWIAHFMGVVPGDPNCKTSKWGYSSPGQRYMTLATTSGGAVESICDADLRRALQNVKARVIEVATEYPLGSVPNESTIRVWIDGKEVPKDPNEGWTYVKETNSIRFHGSSVPTPGSRIRVKFDPGTLD